jgi:hypothetical protein
MILKLKSVLRPCLLVDRNIIFIISLISAITLVSYFPSVSSQPSEFSTNSSRPFGVVITIYGLNNNTNSGDIISYINADNITRVKVINSSQVVQNSSGESIVRFTIPEATIKPSEPYTACVIETSKQIMQCLQGHKSPEDRAEYIEFSASP